METLVLVVHIIAALAMIGLILIQQGKGAEQGASFGAGASGTVFGSAGSANFLTKSTAVLTAIFFMTSISLAVFAKHNAQAAFSLSTTEVTAPVVSTNTAKTPETSPTAPATTSNAPANPVN